VSEIEKYKIAYQLTKENLAKVGLISDGETCSAFNVALKKYELIKVGMADANDLEGGMVFLFKHKETREEKRIILCYTELGEWIEFNNTL
jgi:hypothetical protein